MTKTVKIKNTKPRLYTANGVTLQPGLNSLSEDDAKKFLEHPHIKIKIERGIIELERGGKLPETPKADAPPKETAAQKKAREKAEKEAADKAAADGEGDGDDTPYGVEEPPYGVGGLNAGEAIEKIKEIEDIDYLVAVAEKDERKTVKEAAENRVLDLQGE